MTHETSMRRCIGSKTHGIKAHEAPPSDFPIQPSQKDGLGRMCKSHWNAYTTALRNAALARKAADGGVATEVARPADGGTTPARKRGELARDAPVGGRKPTAPKPGSTRFRNAKAVVAATEALGGAAYTDAVGSDEVQAALAVLGSRADAGDPADIAQEETAAA